MTDNDDLLGDRLRRALADEAERVRPAGDGLSRIQEKVAAQRTPRWWWNRPSALVLGAAAVAAVATAGIVVGLGGNEPTATRPAASAPASPTVTSPGVVSPTVRPSPTESVSPGSEPTGAATTPGGPAVPPAAGRTMTTTVYYAGPRAGDGGAGGAGGAGLALYRERYQVPLDTGVVRVAVQRLLGGRPADRDYQNLWPAGTVLGATIHGDTIVLDLSASVAGRSASAEAARLGVQQLVYTATEAGRRPDGAVELRVAGRPVSSLWGHPVGAQPLRRANASEVLAPVWITAPGEGARVGRTVAVQGEASVFEATVNWEVRRVGGGVVDQGFTTASAGAPGRGSWRQRLTLAPGRYELRAFEVSAQDGSRLATDTKTVTVR